MHAHARIQCGGGVLENNGYHAANLAAVRGRTLGHFLPAEKYLPRGWDLQPTHDIRGGGLAAARLTHDADGFTRINGKREPLDSVDVLRLEQATVAGSKAHFDIAQLNDGACRGWIGLIHDLRSFLG